MAQKVHKDHKDQVAHKVPKGLLAHVVYRDHKVLPVP
jgi:hypothetical protein